MADNNWDGSTDNNWNVDANWSLGTKPGATDDVIIDIANATVEATSAISFQSLRIGSSDTKSQLIIDGLALDLTGETVIDLKALGILILTNCTVDMNEASNRRWVLTQGTLTVSRSTFDSTIVGTPYSLDFGPSCTIDFQRNTLNKIITKLYRDLATEYVFSHDVSPSRIKYDPPSPTIRERSLYQLTGKSSFLGKKVARAEIGGLFHDINDVWDMNDLVQQDVSVKFISKFIQMDNAFFDKSVPIIQDRKIPKYFPYTINLVGE